MEFDGGVIFSAFINLAIAIYLFFLLFSYRAYLWHKTEAVIIRSELKGARDSDGDMMYGPEIEYEYLYAGRKYINNYISVAVGTSNIKSETEHILARYGKGWKVDVYVNPKNPSKSILAPGIRLHHLTLLAILGLFYWLSGGWHSGGDVSVQSSALFAEEMIPIEIDVPTKEKVETAYIIKARLLDKDIKSIIQKKYNYITPMAMDEGFQLTVKEELFTKSVQIICSFEHTTSKNYPITVTKECRRLVDKELKNITSH